jgi:hypothetical protein
MVTVAIVPKGINVSPDELALVASAINLQVNRDLSKPWNVQATVTTFPDDTVPLARGFVPVYVMADTGESDGIHRLSAKGTLFAIVRYATGMRWSLAASHEILELLVDPTLHFMLPGPLLGQPSVTVQYLVEICDPCEGPDYAYQVDKAHAVYVSDFCLPSYYWSSPSPSAPFSCQDNLPGPGTVTNGGRVTWRDSSGTFFQKTRVGGPERVVGNLTEAEIFGDSQDRSNIRGAIDRHPFHQKGRARPLRPLAPNAIKHKSVGKIKAAMDRHLKGLVQTDRRSQRRR